MKYTKLGDLSELRTTIKSLAVAELRPIYVDGSQPKQRAVQFGIREKESKLFGVWNKTDQTLSAVVSERYALLQHGEFFAQVADAVEKTELPIETIYLRDYRTRVWVEFLLAEKYSIGEQEILLGFRAGNSFDKGVRALVGAYGLRQVCTNGLMGKALFGKSSAIHAGNLRVEEVIKGLEKTLPVAKEFLQGVIGKASKTTIKRPKEVLKRVGFGKNYQKYIMETIGRQEPTRWALYNATTEVIDHREKTSESVRERLHDMANGILVGV